MLMLVRLELINEDEVKIGLDVDGRELELTSPCVHLQVVSEICLLLSVWLLFVISQKQQISFKMMIRSMDCDGIFNC